MSVPVRAPIRCRPQASRYYMRPDVTCIPIHDAAPFEGQFIWRMAAETRVESDGSQPDRARVGRSIVETASHPSYRPHEEVPEGQLSAEVGHRLPPSTARSSLPRRSAISSRACLPTSRWSWSCTSRSPPPTSSWPPPRHTASSRSRRASGSSIGWIATPRCWWSAVTSTSSASWTPAPGATSGRPQPGPCSPTASRGRAARRGAASSR